MHKNKQMQGAISIEKVKIKDGIPTISYTAADAKGKKYSIPGAEYSDPVHIDFQKALDTFNVHLALSTSMLPIPGEISDINSELLTYYHMHGVSIKDDGVTLSGHKILPNKKPFNFNSPFIRFSESEETQYTFIDELIEHLERLTKEVHAYLDGSKRADDAQFDLFNQKPEPVTKVHVAEPVKEGVLVVETPTGKVELPILPTNGVIAGVDTKEPKEEKPFERPMMDEFEEKPKPKEPKAAAKKRVPQSAANPSGIVETE